MNDDKKEVPEYVSYFYHEAALVRSERIARRLMRLNIIKDIMLTAVIYRFMKYLGNAGAVSGIFSKELTIAFALLTFFELAVHYNNGRDSGR